MSNQAMYGYQDDDVKTGSGLQFGLNAGSARLTKFEWINDAGKDGAEAEALDIQFMIAGGDRPISYRKFPITRAFDKSGQEILDPNDPVFIKAVREFNAVIMHVMHCFVDTVVLQQRLATPISNFKEFCSILKSLLPADFNQRPLDIFGQWQWQLHGENKRTFLELPKKMTSGRWVCIAQQPAGSWHEVKVENPGDNNPLALKYVDDAGKVHPFKRNGWFMNSNFAKEQISEIEDGGTGGYQPQGEATAGWAGAASDQAATPPPVNPQAQQQSWDDLANKE